MKIKITEDTEREQALIDQLLKVWESAVKATHLFLSESEIENIKKYVLQALKEIPNLIVSEDETGRPIAFMGIDGQKLEMLFVASKEIGKGIGKKLIRYGMDKYLVSELTVNEQNLMAKGFYEHMGFQVYKRAEMDEQGESYPILYMKLS